LSGPNDLRPANYQAAPTHLCQNICDSLINFLGLDNVRLKGSAKIAIDWPDRQGNEIRVVFEYSLEPLIIALHIQGLDSASDLKRAGKTGNDVTVSLAVEFNLARFVLNQLGLIPALYRAQFVGATA
jgi:hypothetical protein